ncbi:MAG: ABC transporter ATP-binding protein [Deltaproteobacteria bacterium]|nr:ABC transporter ATP-binding protein [Deltaproteobacteria bacterium]
MGGQSTVLLELRNISKRFGATQALTDFSIDVRQGEIFTLLGPSGCGKSTTLRIVAGLEDPDTGEVRLKGRTIVEARTRNFTPPDARNMGMVFQAFAVWPHMTVFENIAFPLRVRRERKPGIQKKVMDALELVGLAQRAAEYPWQLSGGMQQRVALARALVYTPDMLLLDEPLSNLDAKLREQMRVELRTLQRQLGTTYLFVTHDQAEAMILSTRIAVINLGRLEQVGTPAEVYEQPATPFVRDFLGRSVLLQGTFRREGRTSWVDLDLGAHLSVSSDNDQLPDGKAVTVACRTECIRIEPPGERADDQIAAVIEDATYIGDRIDYLVRAGDRFLTVCRSAEERYSIGDRVCLCFSQRGITVWPNAS